MGRRLQGVRTPVCGVWRELRCPRGSCGALWGWVAPLIMLLTSLQLQVRAGAQRESETHAGGSGARTCVGALLSLSCAAGRRLVVTGSRYGRTAWGCGGAPSREVCGADDIRFHPCTGMGACMWKVPPHNLPGCGRADYIELEHQCLKASDIHDVCSGDVVTSRSGFVSSPRYPGSLPVNSGTRCVVRVAPPGGGTVNVYVTDVGRGDCQAALHIREVGGRTRRVRLCTATLPGRGERVYEGSSSGGHVSISYTQTDTGNTARGFLLYYNVTGGEPFETAAPADVVEVATITLSTRPLITTTTSATKPTTTTPNRTPTTTPQITTPTTTPQITTPTTASQITTPTTALQSTALQTTPPTTTSSSTTTTATSPTTTTTTQTRAKSPITRSTRLPTRASTRRSPTTGSASTYANSHKRTTPARSPLPTTPARMSSVNSLRPSTARPVRPSSGPTTSQPRAVAGLWASTSPKPELLVTLFTIGLNETHSHNNTSVLTREKARLVGPWAGIVGGVIASVAVLLLLAIVVIMVWEKRKKKSARTRMYDDVMFGERASSNISAPPPKLPPFRGRVYENMAVNNAFLPDIEASLRQLGSLPVPPPGGGAEHYQNAQVEATSGLTARVCSASSRRDPYDDVSLAPSRPVPAQRLSLSLKRPPPPTEPPPGDDTYCEVGQHLGDSGVPPSGAGGGAACVPEPPVRNSSRQVAGLALPVKPPLKPKPTGASLREWLGRAAGRLATREGELREGSDTTPDAPPPDVLMVENDVYESEEVRRG